MPKRALLATLLTLVGYTILQAETLPAGRTVSIPAGTVLHCRTAQTLTTKLNTQGQSFTATVSEPILAEGHEVIPAGSTITGRIAMLERPGRIRGVGMMRLNAETLAFPDGRTFPLAAVLMTQYGADNAKVVGDEGTIKGPSSRVQTAEEVGGGSAVGSLIGLIAGHPWVGVAVGGAAGFVDRVRRRGKDLNVPAGTQLNYQLTRALELTPPVRQAGAASHAAQSGN